MATEDRTLHNSHYGNKSPMSNIQQVHRINWLE